MRPVVVAGVVGALVVAVLAFSHSLTRPAVTPPPGAARERAPAPRASREAETPAGARRNVFEYESREPVMADPGARQDAPATADQAQVIPPPPVFVAPPAEPAVRLVGVVERAGKTKAALFIAGELAVLAAGESAGGYEVLAIDEETGVRLRGPDGELTLTAPVR